MPPTLPRIHVLIKPTGASCNLNCAYCFYLQKSDLYAEKAPRMSVQLLEIYIRQLLEAHQSNHITIAWQGGEPTLMGLDFYRAAVALQNKHRRSDTVFENTLQTNGTLLDEAWCAFLKQHNFLVGISIDGPRHLHDTFRKDRGGGATFDRVLNGLRLLQKHGVDYNILTAVNRVNGDHPLEVYHFLRNEIGADWLQFIPVVERVAGTVRVSSRSVAPRQWGRFLTAAFDEWVRQDVGRVFVQTFEAAVRNALKLPTSGMCVFDERCGLGPVLEHNGDVYACDHFVTPSHLLGNIRQTHLAELVASQQQRDFGSAKSARLPPECVTCDVRAFCHGACPRNRFVRASNGDATLNYLCSGYRAFFRHAGGALSAIAELFRQGRPAAEIMRLIAARDGQQTTTCDKSPPNAPCPCGSGRKFKKCHGRKGLDPTPATLKQQRETSADPRT